MQQMLGHTIAGFGYGYIEKSFPNLPTLPVVGRAGTIAVIAKMAIGKVPYAREVCMFAAGLAGYQMGTQGHVLGDVVPQVHGIASQV